MGTQRETPSLRFWTSQLHFYCAYCAFLCSAQQGGNSATKSPSTGEPDLLPIPTLKLPPFYPVLCITVTQHPRMQTFCSPLAELQARLLVPLWGRPSGAAPWEPQGPCGDTVAKGGVGSSQPPLQCDWGQPLWGPWLKAGQCGDLGTCHGFSSFS